jgi:hypothetical protein
MGDLNPNVAQEAVISRLAPAPALYRGGANSNYPATKADSIYGQVGFGPFCVPVPRSSGANSTATHVHLQAVIVEDYGLLGLGKHILERLTLYLQQLLNPFFGQVQHLLHLCAGEGGAFARSLHLHEFAHPGHHHVEIDLGARIFCIVEIEPRFSAYDANAHGGDGGLERAGEADLSRINLPSARARATYAPVMAAVRVPPSAWITLQFRREIYWFCYVLAALQRVPDVRGN